MTRLVVVSNRVPRPLGRSTDAGGLAVAMRDALRQRGGLWFGWSGGIAEGSSTTPQVTNAGLVTYVTVDLSQTDYDHYYVGYANGTLWPLLHYRLGLVDYSRRAFEGYWDVNAYLARMLQPLLQPDDLIWVQDYHLIPFGAELRKLGVGNRIGFFLHTPFPPAEVMAALPRWDMLLKSFCSYDLIGFQTDENVRAFQSCVVGLGGGADLGDGMFRAFGRRFQIGTFPVGIDTLHFAEVAEQARGSPETRQLADSLQGRSLVIGVDRLDYSKGIESRFQAINALLTDHPNYRRRFSYLQITPHSRTTVAQYRRVRRELEQATGRVNGKFAEFDWAPVRYLNKSFSRQTLAGFHRLARVGLVTPFRDGMNLVAKEFVAAQDPENPGVLILSVFAGAAEELQSALQVNPLDIDEIAAALYRALTMPLEERRDRWQAMMTVLQRNTVSAWRERYLLALQGIAVAAE